MKKLDKFERAKINHKFETEMLRCRDMLKPIITGEIERGHCVAGQSVGYGANPGMRKTKLADAVKIAKTIEFIISRAIQEFHDDYANDEG